MRLNERAVASYAVGTSRPDRQGFLWKKGELNTSYQRRWFVLRGNLLFYFERPGEREPQGLVVLEGCSVQLCESAAEGFAFSVLFERAAGLRLYKLVAEDQRGQEAWVKALSSASLLYIRQLLRELEAQFEGLYRPGAGAGPHRNTWLGLPRPPASSRDARCQSLTVLPPDTAHPRRSPKLWPHHQRQAQRQAQQQQADTVAPGDAAGGSGGWAGAQAEDFLTLHRRYGAEVEKVRREWRLRWAGGLGAGAEPALGTDGPGTEPGQEAEGLEAGPSLGAMGQRADGLGAGPSLGAMGQRAEGLGAGPSLGAMGQRAEGLGAKPALGAIGQRAEGLGARPALGAMGQRAEGLGAKPALRAGSPGAMGQGAEGLGAGPSLGAMGQGAEGLGAGPSLGAMGQGAEGLGAGPSLGAMGQGAEGLGAEPALGAMGQGAEGLGAEPALGTESLGAGSTGAEGVRAEPALGILVDLC